MNTLMLCCGRDGIVVIIGVCVRLMIFDDGPLAGISCFGYWPFCTISLAHPSATLVSGLSSPGIVAQPCAVSIPHSGAKKYQSSADGHVGVGLMRLSEFTLQLVRQVNSFSLERRTCARPRLRRLCEPPASSAAGECDLLWIIVSILSSLSWVSTPCE